MGTRVSCPDVGARNACRIVRIAAVVLFLCALSAVAAAQPDCPFGPDPFGGCRDRPPDAAPPEGVRVISTPADATVFEGARELGKTPLWLDTRRLSAGTHTLRLEKLGYETEAREVRVVRGRLANLRVTLRAQPLLHVVADARFDGALVSIDGTTVGALPMRPFPVPAGPHEVRVQLENHRPFLRPVTLTAGAPVLELPVELAPEVGTIVVGRHDDDDARGGEAFLLRRAGDPPGTAERTPLGRTPTAPRRIGAGRQTVEVHYDGLPPEVYRVDVPVDGTVEVRTPAPVLVWDESKTWDGDWRIDTGAADRACRRGDAGGCVVAAHAALRSRRGVTVKLTVRRFLGQLWRFRLLTSEDLDDDAQRRRDALLDRARDHYLRGCELGDGFSCAALAYLYWSGTIQRPQRVRVAIHYFARACAAGLEPACWARYLPPSTLPDLTANAGPWAAYATRHHKEKPSVQPLFLVGVGPDPTVPSYLEVGARFTFPLTSWFDLEMVSGLQSRVVFSRRLDTDEVHTAAAGGLGYQLGARLRFTGAVSLHAAARVSLYLPGDDRASAVGALSYRRGSHSFEVGVLLDAVPVRYELVREFGELHRLQNHQWRLVPVLRYAAPLSL